MAMVETQEGNCTGAFQALVNGQSKSYGPAQILETGMNTPMEVERGINIFNNNVVFYVIYN